VKNKFPQALCSFLFKQKHDSNVLFGRFYVYIGSHRDPYFA